jgi:nucleotide-binding universal stress UspA family protein
VHAELARGVPDEALVAHAERAGARLLVVSSTGRRAPARWWLGSVAERTAQTSPVPVLVVRDASPFVAWAAGARRLRVLVAVDFSHGADAAIDWVAGLRAIGACDVIVAHSSWPPAERRRLGMGVRRTVLDNDPEIDAVLRHDLEGKAAALAGEGEVRIRVETSLGQVARHLVAMAVEEGVDLVVTGAHRGDRTGQRWYASVSRGVLHAAPMTVACVPAPRPTAREVPSLPGLGSVLAATDFSDLGDRAVPHAYAMLPQGGTVHLVHVVEMAEVNDLAYPHYDTGFPPTDEQRGRQEPELTAQLRALVPADAARRGIDTRIHLVEARVAGAALAAAAERLAVDVICVGSRGRTGLAAAVIGSVAQDLIAGSGRPVLVVGPGPR